MAKKKTRRDTAEIARSIVEQVTGGKLNGEPLDEVEPDQRNPKAVSRGKIGGDARAKVLTSEERTNIASKAARKRWKKQSD